MSKLNWWKTAYAVILLYAATAIAGSAQTFTLLFGFDGTDGYGPYTALVQGVDGKFYGTTVNGGDVVDAPCPSGCGTAYKITPEGTLTTLASFGNEFSSPFQLALGLDGNLYGATFYGGSYGGEGWVFKVTPEGTLTGLAEIGQSTGLVLGGDGNFYGTTSCQGEPRCGTVFRVTPNGRVTNLYDFCSQSDCTDGTVPHGVLIQATDGNFYGTTEGGGAYTACNAVYGLTGCGTVFRITPGGKLTTLHSFNYADGAGPFDGVIQAKDGDFYGTTFYGGMEGLGTVFKMTPEGALPTLYSFCPKGGQACPDGSEPYAGLIQATDGNLYGTTSSGGAYLNCYGYVSECGTIFQITLDGRLTTLHSFDGYDGGLPLAALVQGTDGNLYGTANPDEDYGGGDGTIFRLSLGLDQFVKTVPPIGRAGRQVIILGTNLKGATSVTFNGIAAAFRVVSKSAISTSVPAGASSGKVEVVTPSGTLSSNVPFRVAP